VHHAQDCEHNPCTTSTAALLSASYGGEASFRFLLKTDPRVRMIKHVDKPQQTTNQTAFKIRFVYSYDTKERFVFLLL